MTEVLIPYVLSVRFKSSRAVSDHLVRGAMLFSKAKGAKVNITLPIMIALRIGDTTYSRAVRINLFECDENFVSFIVL